MLHLCCIFDKQAESFGRPMAVPAKGLAIRSFIDEVNREDNNNMYYMHPDDFVLYHVGDFNDSDGSIDASMGHTILMTGEAAKSVK